LRDVRKNSAGSGMAHAKGDLDQMGEPIRESLGNKGGCFQQGKLGERKRTQAGGNVEVFQPTNTPALG